MAAVRALARYESFRMAADVLGTSPASFSRYIAQAEDYAGHALFKRGGTRVSMTAAGKEFLNLLDALNNASVQFETGVKRLRSGGPETLNIGCGPLTTRTIISPLLAELLKEQPNLRARVQVRATKEPLEALRQGKLDVVVCDLTHTPDLRDLDIQVLRKEPVTFWARPEHPLHGSAPVSVAEIFSNPFITAHLHRHWRAAIANTLGGDEDAWKIVDGLPQVESDDFAFMTDLACNANLICGAMREDFAQHSALGLLKEIETHETLTWNICAARRKNTEFPVLDLFWKRLCDQFGSE